MRKIRRYGKGKGDSKEKGKGQGECWNCGVTGHRALECKSATKKAKGKGMGSRENGAG